MFKFSGITICNIMFIKNILKKVCLFTNIVNLKLFFFHETTFPKIYNQHNFADTHISINLHTENVKTYHYKSILHYYFKYIILAVIAKA